MYLLTDSAMLDPVWSVRPHPTCGMSVHQVANLDPCLAALAQQLPAVLRSALQKWSFGCPPMLITLLVKVSKHLLNHYNPANIQLSQICVNPPRNHGV